MRTPQPLPASLGSRFTVQDAAAAGVNRGRLHRRDVAIPFRGVRAKPVETNHHALDPYARQAAERRIRAWEYVPRLSAGQFVSHESAVAMRGGPLPLVWVVDEGKEEPAEGRALPVHVSTFGDGALVRAAGVRGHRADPRFAQAAVMDGVAIATSPTMWAQLGTWSIFDLVALGDFLCRVRRPGYGRKEVGRAPFTTIDDLRATVSAGRWGHVRRLREAVELVREDSWSPRESRLRLDIVFAGLPEPLLNQDVYDDHGRFLGCVDLAYPDRKIAIEYHGALHSGRYAADVERIAALRAAGWIVIEVTSASRTENVLARIRHALRR
ncbi:hypothetical protein L2X99_16640 [Microbacterium sp. KUDC0406]|uniref:hypothetical protein n=1 Tax=Microbacterium sp. KUDC0406 TaxID=2909588 RepID=UPI001F3F09C6|nr:hypothetical protein [Microbacterium sp. KUDC0406]UJP09970.1 hypothetical protein L2X99_16640 [Microbacterium sp. KUDC0406]